MIKDIVVNLTIGVERDAAANYAISLASIFKAHLVGVAFVYDPKASANLIVGIPAELIDAQRATAKHLANEAVAQFEALAKQAGVMTELQIIDVAPGHVGDTFGRLARNFDLSVIRQAEPNKAEQQVPIIEGALFELWASSDRRAVRSDAGRKIQSGYGRLGRKSSRGSRHW